MLFFCGERTSWFSELCDWTSGKNGSMFGVFVVSFGVCVILNCVLSDDSGSGSGASVV